MVGVYKLFIVQVHWAAALCSFDVVHDSGMVVVYGSDSCTRHYYIHPLRDVKKQFKLE